MAREISRNRKSFFLDENKLSFRGKTLLLWTRSCRCCRSHRETSAAIFSSSFFEKIVRTLQSTPTPIPLLNASTVCLVNASCLGNSGMYFSSEITLTRHLFSLHLNYTRTFPHFPPNTNKTRFPTAIYIQIFTSLRISNTESLSLSL